jgi:hypothetical protein
MALEVLGISGRGYDFTFVKISTYINPSDYSKQVRLVIKVLLKSKSKEFSNPIHIYFQSNHGIEIQDKILDRSRKTIDKRYLRRIGADKNKKVSIPFEIASKNIIKGEKNRLRVEIIPDSDKMLEEIRKKKLENKAEITCGLMLDIVIKNEGIEKESLLKRLLGWSRFAWKFHFKVWSMTEDLEPVKALSAQTEEHESQEVYFTNQVDEIQMFLMIPKELVESHGQIVAHPGGDAVHITTRRDRNTFLISEEDQKVRDRISEEDQKVRDRISEEDQKVRDRIVEWVEEGSMTISWGYGQTGSMSREAIVEHRRAHPKAWTSLIFATLIAMMAIDFLPRNFICPMIDLCSSKPQSVQWLTMLPTIVIPVLFVSGYIIINIYNFSFYELRKKTLANYLRDFSLVLVGSTVAMFISIPVFIQLNETITLSENLILFAVVIIIIVYILSASEELREIRERKVRIKETERIPHLIFRFVVQIIGTSIVVLLWTRLANLEMNFLIPLSYVYATVIGLPLTRHLFRRSEISNPDSDFI